MASIFGHFIVGYTSARLGKTKPGWKLVVLALISSFVPDADVIAFQFDIPYEHLFGHRGITHSIFFALLWSGLLTVLFFRKKPWLPLIILFLATMSHSVLDACTTGGLGVAFFAPFDETRYFLPWRVIKVSPIGVGEFFTQKGWAVIKSELLWVALPCVVLLGLNRLLLKR